MTLVMLALTSSRARLGQRSSGSPSAWAQKAAMTPPEVTATVPPGSATRCPTAARTRSMNAVWLSL